MTIQLPKGASVYEVDVTILGPGGGGGTRKNFDRDARVTFLGLKFDKLLFFGCSKWGLFWGGSKNKHYFLGVNKKFAYFFFGC